MSLCKQPFIKVIANQKHTTYIARMQISQIKAAQLDTVLIMYFKGLEHELGQLNKIIPGRKTDPSGIHTLKILLARMIESGEGSLFLAQNNEQPVGYCLVTKKIYPSELPKSCGCINGIFVDESFRRHGVGKKLYEAAQEWLKKENISYCELYYTINDDTARGFWEKMGYVSIQTNCAKKI